LDSEAVGVDGEWDASLEERVQGGKVSAWEEGEVWRYHLFCLQSNHKLRGLVMRCSWDVCFCDVVQNSRLLIEMRQEDQNLLDYKRLTIRKLHVLSNLYHVCI
jgi:hypothetical protein